MRAYALALSLVLAFACAAVAGGTAAGSPDTEPTPVPAPTSGGAAASERPTVVTLGFYIFDVRQVDIKAQSFFCDFYMWMRYGVQDPERAKEIERIEFTNGKVDTRDELDRKKVGAETYICWRVNGTFTFKADLRNYPFDTQTIEVIVEHPSLETDDVVYQVDEASYERSGVPKHLWGVKDGLDIPEFTLRGTSRRAMESAYKTDFGDPSRVQTTSVYSKFVFSMRFARDFMPYFFKIIIPLAVIVAMAYLVFFLPPKEIQSASGLAITALLSCIAFNLTVTQNLPEVGYLVVSDKFFITTYFLLFLTLLQSVLTYGWDDAGKKEFAQKWDNVCRYVFPILYVSAFAYLLVEALVAS